MTRTPIIAAALMLAIGGCQTSAKQTAATVSAGLAVAGTTSPKVQKTIATLDQKTAQASAKLAQYCSTLQLTLSGASLFSRNSAGAIASAKTMVSDFCANPPADVDSAVQLIAAVIDDLKAQGVTAKTLTTLKLQLGRSMIR